MKNTQIKCSMKNHEKSDVNHYCQECKIYMCNKCENLHSELFQNHHLLKLGKDNKELFTGYCSIESHVNKLDFFCKDHNQLCCLECISKFKDKYNNQHSNCNICIIEDIKEEKKKKLNDNLKNLENLYKTIGNSITQIKLLYENLNKEKEDLKKKIQIIFTKIRTALNEREDELISDIDKNYDKFYFTDEFGKNIENLPKKIKLSLESNNLLKEDWDNRDRLNFLINESIKVENNISEINSLNNIITKTNKINIEINFGLTENEVMNYINQIKSFGNIIYINKNKIQERQIIIEDFIKENIRLKNEFEKKIKNKREIKEFLQKEDKNLKILENKIKENEKKIENNKKDLEKMKEEEKKNQYEHIDFKQNKRNNLGNQNFNLERDYFVFEEKVRPKKRKLTE